MSAHAQNPPENAAERASSADGAVDLETVAIELNFNAFADHVPPTQHARRVAKLSDPSVQDFADQALELATLRAEVKRLTRDYDVSQNAVRVRDMRLSTMQDDLAAARIGLRNTTQQLLEAQSRLAAMSTKAAQESTPPAPVLTPSAIPVLSVAVATPEAQAVEAAQPAASDGPETPTLELPAVSQTTADMTAPVSESNATGRKLVPFDHFGAAVALTREIMTIGRTRANDICIPSGAVSRDHARLLVTPRSVTIVDIGSANGCFVNEERVSKHKLRNGDVLRVGDRTYRFIEGSG